MENKEMERQIRIMEKYFELICDLGYDYDGCNTVEGLKSLIDELVRLASLGRVANDTEVIYSTLEDEEGNEEKYNILHEKIDN